MLRTGLSVDALGWSVCSVLTGCDGSRPSVEIGRPGHPVEPMMPLQMSSDAKGLVKGD